MRGLCVPSDMICQAGNRAVFACRYMMQSNGGNSSQYSPGSILRPALKRSASVGLIGMKSSSEGLSDMDELSSDIEA